MDERRKHKRHLSQKGAIVMHSENIGEIINMSMGGLLCQCIINTNTDDNGRSCELDIYCGHDHCHLQHIQFKRVSEWVGEDKSLCSVLVRKCGVQFRDLSMEQQAKLKRFIENHTS